MDLYCWFIAFLEKKRPDWIAPIDAIKKVANMWRLPFQGALKCWYANLTSAKLADKVFHAFGSSLWTPNWGLASHG